MDDSVSREQYDAVVAQLAAANARIAELELLVAKLVEEKGRNSSNSIKPPSSDSPSNRAQRRAAKAKERSGKKRGGQPGHEGSQRALLPPDEVKDHFPDECENCFSALPKVADRSPLRYQTTDLPPVKPHTLEHRVHCVSCPQCKHRTTAAFEIPPRVRFLTEEGVLLDGAVPPLADDRTRELYRHMLGTNQSFAVTAASEPTWHASWPKLGANVPMRPWRWSFSRRSSKSRARSMWR